VQKKSDYRIALKFNFKVNTHPGKLSPDNFGPTGTPDSFLGFLTLPKWDMELHITTSFGQDPLKILTIPDNNRRPKTSRGESTIMRRGKTHANGGGAWTQQSGCFWPAGCGSAARRPGPGQHGHRSINPWRTLPIRWTDSGTNPLVRKPLSIQTPLRSNVTPPVLY